MIVKRKTSLRIRKIHRYLGIFIGLQFIMWTVSGLYFSWTDIDEIHGDQFKKLPPETIAFSNLKGIGDLLPGDAVTSVDLKDISGEPYYFINSEKLVHAENGKILNEISEEQALDIAARHVRDELQVSGIRKIDSLGAHHEYRGGSLPAYEISYDTGENLKAYVGARDASFKSVRFRDWRWFDFLWMMHTMDYQTRDDFNNWLLRIFSVSGLVAVLSGFVLWYVSSPSVRKVLK